MKKKKYGSGMGIGEHTEMVDPNQEKNGHSFILRQGDIYTLTDHLPYARLDESDLSQETIKYGVFYDKKGEFEKLVSSVIPTQDPDEYKCRLLEGNVLDILKSKNEELNKIKKEVGEKNYELLWKLPRKYLNFIRDIGVKKEEYDRIREEEEELKTQIDERIEKIEKIEGSRDKKRRLQYLIENSPYICNTDLIIGSGKLADIKLDVVGISKIQGLIFPNEGFGSMEYSNCGKYGANIINFMGNFKEGKFTPLSYKMGNEIVDSEKAQLTYLFLFGEEELKELEDFRASSLYITFLKPEGVIDF